MVGRTIGKYRIVEQIGRGGMGTVYKAIDETLDRRVAIKVLNADLIDQEAVERFRREAVTLAKLNHPRIGAIHELTRDGHDLLMVMEFLEGETFEKLIERGPMTVNQAVALCAQVLEALQYAHGAGVVHRDLKPANIIVTPTGEIKVMDFGIARVQGSEHLTTNGYMVGTPAYMAPEQVRGEEVDPRMDLYSIAVVLYRMLTQRLPFSGDTAIAMIHSQLNNQPTPVRQFRADLPEWLVGILTKGLSKTAPDRFQSAAEFKTALENGLAGRVTTDASLDAVTVGRMPTPAAAQASPTASAVAAVAVGPSTVTGTSAGVAAGRTGERPIASAPPVSAAAPKPEPTVTLRAPHLATAGVLVAVLIVGIVVLAFIALRRPATVVEQPPPAATAAAPATADNAATPPASGATPGAEPSPTTTATASPNAPATAQAVPVPPSTAASGSPAASTVAATPKPATTTAAPTSATTSTAGTTSGTAAANVASPSRGTPARGTAPLAATAVPPLAPAAANAPAENFGDVRTIVTDAGKNKEADALLSLEPGTLIIRSKSDGSVLRNVPYVSIAEATYNRGRRPKGQTTAGLAQVPDNLGGGAFGGARHWLTLQTPLDYIVIRLEDRNVMRVLNSIEQRTGRKINRSAE